MNSNSNSSSNYIITSDYNSELKNNSYINNYKEEGEEKSYCCWSHEEEQIFQNALAEMDPNSPTFYQDLASRIPWKYIHEIKQHYRELTGETDSSGHVPDDDEEKRPIIIQRIISPPPQEIINENVVVSTPDRSTKNVPWTKEEHQLFLMGLEIYGKGKWKFISKFFVQTRTPVQVASHAQKFFAHHRKLDKNNCSKPPPPRFNKVRRHSIFDNADPYFLPDSQEPYSYPPPPPLLPPPVVMAQNNHHHPPPNDHEQTGFLDSIISFPGIGNITDDDQSATALSWNHQLFYNPNTITATDSFLQRQNVEPITGGGEEDVFFAQTDDHHQYYNPSSSSSAGSTNGNYNYQGGI